MIPAEDLKNRLLTLLVSRKGQFAAANPELDKFDHSLQCATRAYRVGEPPDYVVMALFHDVFGGFSADAHGRMAAAVLAPYIRPLVYEACQRHEIAMEHLRQGRPLEWQPEIHFAQQYDMPSFDPNYKSEELAFFYPLIDEVIHD